MHDITDRIFSQFAEPAREPLRAILERPRVRNSQKIEEGGRVIASLEPDPGLRRRPR